jgi:hypothetical protein
MMVMGWALAAILAGRIAGAPLEDYSTWAHSAKIHFNTTETGAGVLGLSIERFPILIRIASPSKVLTQSLAAGADLRFADPDGTPLDLQIERWDAAAGKAEVWVNVPKIDANSDKDYIVAYWGKANPAWLSDGSKVFPGSMGFSGVWHLGEGGTQSRVNSVGTGNHATPRNYDGDERREGVIGMADSLDGAATGDYLDLGSGFANIGNGFTFSVWVHSTGVGIFSHILDLGNGTSQDNVVFGRYDTTQSVYYHAYTESKASSRLIVENAIEERSWVHLGLTQYGNEVSVYKNGVKLGYMTNSVLLRNILRSKNFLGRSNWSDDAYFRGKIDEPQVCASYHSPDWMKLAYETQRPDSKLITWEFPPEIKLAITAQPVSVTVAEGHAASLSVTGVSGRPISYQWFKNGIAVSGAKSSAFSIASATLEDAAGYYCILSDGAESIQSMSKSIYVTENYATWTHSQKIFFNTTSGGAGVASAVTGFPVLVRLNSTRLNFTQPGTGGRDLRFADPDGTALPFQIERWDSAGAAAEIWVRVPKVDGASDKDYITMYWGKLNAKAASNPAAVFSAADKYQGVWHFNEAFGAALDATANGFQGTPGGVVAGGAGVIGSR